jgi:hypothetical protein
VTVGRGYQRVSVFPANKISYARSLWMQSRVLTLKSRGRADAQAVILVSWKLEEFSPQI